MNTQTVKVLVVKNFSTCGKFLGKQFFAGDYHKTFDGRKYFRREEEISHPELFDQTPLEIVEEVKNFH